ncbi:hypothetical protein PENTCL1PPCAC_9989 [Pristionchus entomophagus]|uniref:Uncharacterized protein n=1 Tax=Pristionchus entomophagus TaxID=358040 RepID=A0AAV5SY23_9BILA|nr:hypothetical protein PENTCL1PPCAC_9989 [Pristionchus entomophagus]
MHLISLILCLVALAAAPTHAAYATPAVDWASLARTLREEYPTARDLNATYLVRFLADRADELEVDKNEFATNFRTWASIVILTHGERRAMAAEDRAGLFSSYANTTQELMDHLSASFPNHHAAIERRLAVMRPVVEKMSVEAKAFMKRFADSILKVAREDPTRFTTIKDLQAALREELSADYGNRTAACRRELERAFPMRTLREVAGEDVASVTE